MHDIAKTSFQTLDGLLQGYLGFRKKRNIHRVRFGVQGIKQSDLES